MVSDFNYSTASSGYPWSSGGSVVFNGRVPINKILSNREIIYRAAADPNIPAFYTRLSNRYNEEIISDNISLVTIPSSPVEVFAVPGNNKVDIFWFSSQWGSPTSYLIYKSTNSDFSSQSLIHTEISPARQYTDSDVINNTSYYYRMVAVNEIGNSDYRVATNYPDLRDNEIIPLSTYNDLLIPDLQDFWDFNESSAGSSPVVRNSIMLSTWNGNLSDAGQVVSTTGVDGSDVAANFPNGESPLIAGSSYKYCIGYGDCTIVMRVKWTGNNGGTVLQMGDGTYLKIWRNFSGEVQVDSDDLINGNTTSLSIAVTNNEWYVLVVQYDSSVEQLILKIIDSNGDITEESSSVGIGYRKYKSVEVHFGYTMEGVISEVFWFKSILSNSFLLQLYNNNVAFNSSKLRLQPPDDQNNCPFKYYREHNSQFDVATERGIQGLYGYLALPLYLWDASLANTKGRYVWVLSADHIADGIYIGYSNDKGRRPYSYTKIINDAGATVIIHPFLTYISNDINNRPFYLYAHAVATVPGISGAQPLYLWTSSDLETWTAEGIVSMPGTYNGEVLNHHGYINLIRPGDLPNVTDYHLYHLSVDSTTQIRLNISSDPKSFDPSDTTLNLDKLSALPPLHYVEWHLCLLKVGNKVYGIGRSSHSNKFGIHCVEIFEHYNAWRKIGEQCWRLGEFDSQDFPTTNYTQDFMGNLEDGILHGYRLMGYYPQSSEEIIHYQTAVFDETAAATHRPSGCKIEINESNQPVCFCYEVLPNSIYRLYRKEEGGSYSLLGNMVANNGVYSYTDTSANLNTRYIYQVRNCYNNSEINGAELACTPMIIEAVADEGIVTLTWNNGYNGAVYNVYKTTSETFEFIAVNKISNDIDAVSINISTQTDTTLYYYLITETVNGVEGVCGSISKAGLTPNPALVVNYTGSESLSIPSTIQAYTCWIKWTNLNSGDNLELLAIGQDYNSANPGIRFKVGNNYRLGLFGEDGETGFDMFGVNPANPSDWEACIEIEPLEVSNNIRARIAYKASGNSDTAFGNWITAAGYPISWAINGLIVAYFGSFSNIEIKMSTFNIGWDVRDLLI